ncbi:hypothetical protein EIN_485890 [Entamoeba invadens IP1]|uniref:Uncharacterized protein n=1 Tax=Entamoeba invadens IP1 TaxID=370355 RepID=A0A0A1U4K2_ENTIV|nr:hypothetical protein EIN_485890 [Entamoeba invadens IP1]ELP89187.1 hypothetical protein EIN_485890 [Entamoeba invadens IP1]|eukprot:XP_004255958.1 hypothetical protein EIN_485890 [Entamoeba invadens IP1]
MSKIIEDKTQVMLQARERKIQNNTNSESIEYNLDYIERHGTTVFYNKPILATHIKRTICIKCQNKIFESTSSVCGFCGIGFICLECSKIVMYHMQFLNKDIDIYCCEECEKKYINYVQRLKVMKERKSAQSSAIAIIFDKLFAMRRDFLAFRTSFETTNKEFINVYNTDPECIKKNLLVDVLQNADCLRSVCEELRLFDHIIKDKNQKLLLMKDERENYVMESISYLHAMTLMDLEIVENELNVCSIDIETQIKFSALESLININTKVVNSEYKIEPKVIRKLPATIIITSETLSELTRVFINGEEYYYRSKTSTTQSFYLKGSFKFFGYLEIEIKNGSKSVFLNNSVFVLL